MSWIKSFDSARNHLIQLKRISMFESIKLLLAQSHKMAKVRLGFRCQISQDQIHCIKFPTHNPAFFKVHSYFDDWNNIEFNSFGSTQIDICFGQEKFDIWARPEPSWLKPGDIPQDIQQTDDRITFVTGYLSSIFSATQPYLEMLQYVE